MGHIPWYGKTVHSIRFLQIVSESTPCCSNQWCQSNGPTWIHYLATYLPCMILYVVHCTCCSLPCSFPLFLVLLCKLCLTKGIKLWDICNCCHGLKELYRSPKNKQKLKYMCSKEKKDLTIIYKQNLRYIKPKPSFSCKD